VLTDKAEAERNKKTVALASKEIANLEKDKKLNEAIVADPDNQQT